MTLVFWDFILSLYCFVISIKFNPLSQVDSISSGMNIFNLRGVDVISSPEHEVLMVSYCGQSMSVRRAASTIALKAYSSYTPGPTDDTW